MAARRERERRRPSTERRYQFATPESEVETDQTLVEENDEAVEPAKAEQSRAAASLRAARAAPAPTPRTTARPAPKPFSAYKDEYAYVYGDLRRVGAVIGGLLVALVVLYFALPVLVH